MNSRRHALIGTHGCVLRIGSTTRRCVHFIENLGVYGSTIYIEEDARAALEAMRAAEEAARRPPTPPQPTTVERSALSPTEAPTESTITANPAPPAKQKPGVVKKKGAKPKMTAKEKRERGLELERILAALPLEFRGDDPTLRQHVEMVIEKFLDNPGQGFNSASSRPISVVPVSTRLCL